MSGRFLSCWVEPVLSRGLSVLLKAVKQHGVSDESRTSDPTIASLAKTILTAQRGSSVGALSLTWSKFLTAK